MRQSSSVAGCGANSMTEEAKLFERVKVLKSQGMVSLGFTPGPGWSALSREERCKVMNDWLDVSEMWSKMTREEQMQRQIEQVYYDLKKAIKLTKTDVSTLGMEDPETDRRKLRELFGILDMSLLTLGNWVKR